MSRTALALLVLSAGCKRATPAADPEFSDALIYLLGAFAAPEAEVAFAIRELEAQVHSDMDLDASNPADRALAPAALTEADVADLERDNADRDLSRALPVAVAARSPWSPDDHAVVQMLDDHTPVEPYSPEYFVREFVEGGDCWQARDCLEMSTWNDLTKENLLMTVDYDFHKDFRWIDLDLPDPSAAESGEELVNDGAPRWAILGRSWTTESFAGRSDNAWIHQSFTIEVWLPDGDGTVRLLALWSETEFDGLDINDDTVIATTRGGIDRNFQATDDWLEDAR